MVLAHPIIVDEIRCKRIVIAPFDESSIGPASVDLALDKELRVFLPSKKPVPLLHDIDYRHHTRLIDISQGYTLKPGELVMGITMERITLPPDICGWLNSRSTRISRR